MPLNFNPRSDERSDSQRTIKTSPSKHFNPRSDERSDPNSHSPVPAQKPISIHAPTNGATKYDGLPVWSEDISIHAPTNGATPFLDPPTPLCPFQSTLRRTERPHTLSYCFFTSQFQSTLRRTERHWQRPDRNELPRTISIHAPTNGATSFKCYLYNSSLFQSTLRRTERHKGEELVVLFANFNPRSDERSDSKSQR